MNHGCVIQSCKLFTIEAKNKKTLPAYRRENKEREKGERERGV